MRRTHIIFDLDGTLLDTEQLADEVSEEIVGGYGRVWRSDNLEKRVGKSPLAAASAIVEDYELPCSPQEFLKEITEKLIRRWPESLPLPGAVRLLQHLHSHNIPMAIASNSPRRNINAKLSHRKDWNSFFKVIVGGDDVPESKPSPLIFLHTAKLLNVDPSACLVVEDSPTGVVAAKAAGMEVVAVPSLQSESFRHQYAAADHLLSSLLNFKPETWGFPPFEDSV